MSVKVAIRVRPFNERQKFLGCISCVQMKNNTTVVSQNKGKQKKKHYFTFDYSFWSHDGFEQKQNGMLVPIDQSYVDQAKVYSLLGQQILQNAWVGFNCCLFAYGQTGAGKSYSMIGYGSNKGIIPLACQQLFQRIKRFQKKGQRQYQVTISMLQIYNEKVQDLFVNTSKRPLNGLKVRQNKALGVYVQGLNKFPVNSYTQIEKKMQDGSKNRSLAATLMNQYSSRAHTIVMLEFIQKQWISNKKMTKKTSLINLVDLAGSQRVSKTGVGDNKDRLKEASLINKSLHTLGRVIQALADQCMGKGKPIAVPYRQSALTRILQNALGGNSKTTMICAVSPANDNCQETLSTLRYADKTKKIKNKPVVNESEVDKLIRQLREENERLKKMLQAPEDERSSPLKENLLNSTELQKKQMKSNVRASMRQIQKQIRKNLQSFAINTQDVIDEVDYQQSLMMTQFIDLQDPSMTSQFQTSFTSNTGKSQVYITNLSQDQLLNFKIKYSCENDLLITNKNKKQSNKNILEQNLIKKVVLCGLGIQQNHAKITNQNGKYFIQALKDTASEYTLLNGKPVYSKQQLKHNDRIILGTNSVFLFKNITNPQQRINKKYTSQKSVGYQFAINERQQVLQDQTQMFISSSPQRRKNNSGISANEDKQLLKRLQQIEQQFSKMIQENQRKTRQKQDKYKQKLYQLQKEKQEKQIQKLRLQSKLNQKKEETYKLRSKQLQIQKLQKKLEKFQLQRQKRKLIRQSLLLDGLQGNQNNEFIFDAKNFQEIEIGNSGEQFESGKDKRKKGKQNEEKDEKRGALQIGFEEVYLEQYDEKSALGTTQTNTTNVNWTRMEESQLNIEIDIQGNELENLMKKNSKKNVGIEQDLIQTEQGQKYNKIIKVYVDKLSKRMGVFTKIYDITLYSQKINVQKEQQTEEFNCQQNGGYHFCKHCKKVINKVQNITINQNFYEYKQQHQHNQKSKQQKQINSDQKRNELKIRQKVDIKGQRRQYKIELNKSNISDLEKSCSQRRKMSEDEGSRKRSSSMGDESLLLNGTIIQFQQSQKGIKQQKEKIKNRKRVNSENEVRKGSLAEIPESKLEQSRVVKDEQNQNLTMNIQKQITNDLNLMHVAKSSVLQFQQELATHATHQQQSQKEETLIQSFPLHKEHETNHKSIFQLYLSNTQIEAPTQTQSQILTRQNYQISTSKPVYSQIQIQTDIIPQELLKQSLQIKPSKSQISKKAQYLTVDFDLSVSDIESADHQNSIQQSLNLSSLNTFREQELTNQIDLLKQKIKLLQNQNTKQKTTKSKIPQQNVQNILQEQDDLRITNVQKLRQKLKKYSQKQKIDQVQQEYEQMNSPKVISNKNHQTLKKLVSLPQNFSDKEFLKRQKNGLDKQLERQLQNNLIVCNNENIINQRNLNIRKKKKQFQELKKSLFKKQKIELQKQLFILIPMVQKFNLMAKQMNRLIEGKIEIEYRNFSHYQIIEALKNFTKSKWKKDNNFSNVQIRIAIANLEEARIYKWPLEVFKNRFEIAQEIFQKSIENNQEQPYNRKQIDKSKDPFWDPIDFLSSAVGYLSIQCLLYDVEFQGQITFVNNCTTIAQAYVCVSPVKVKRQNTSSSRQQSKQNSVISNGDADNSLQIYNPRNLLQTSLYFNLQIKEVTFIKPTRDHTTAPLKFHISYQLLVDDYKTQNYLCPETQFTNYDTPHQFNYLRRHCFKQISQSTLAYISDCPIKFNLNLMKDYNEECLNSSFNQDLEKSVDQTSIMDLSTSNLDISKDLSDVLSNSSFKTPQKFQEQSERKKPDFSKKQKKPIIYQNSQLLEKMDKQCQQQQRKRKEKRQKLIQKQNQLRNKKEKLKKDEKQCIIY